MLLIMLRLGGLCPPPPCNFRTPKMGKAVGEFCLVCQAMKTCFAINTGKHTFIEFNNLGDSGKTGGKGG